MDLIFTFKGKTVEGFCLDPTICEFVHTRPNMRFPRDSGKRIYSCNEGNYIHWDQHIKDAVEVFKSDVGGTPYSARYVGSMVADIHRTLLYGGIYIYPADVKSPKGKLRCLYEGIPMALIIEQAGGIASTGLFLSATYPTIDHSVVYVVVVLKSEENREISLPITFADRLLVVYHFLLLSLLPLSSYTYLL